VLIPVVFGENQDKKLILSVDPFRIFTGIRLIRILFTIVIPDLINVIFLFANFLFGSLLFDNTSKEGDKVS
jgi:hypothetical protein